MWSGGFYCKEKLLCLEIWWCCTRKINLSLWPSAVVVSPSNELYILSPGTWKEIYCYYKTRNLCHTFIEAAWKYSTSGLTITICALFPPQVWLPGSWTWCILTLATSTGQEGCFRQSRSFRLRSAWHNFPLWLLW